MMSLRLMDNSCLVTFPPSLTGGVLEVSSVPLGRAGGGSSLIHYMQSLRNDEQRGALMRFFKTGPGEYGEGDEFLGLKVPQTREVVKCAWKDLPLAEVPALLESRWHEVRLCGLLILVEKFSRLLARRLRDDAEAAQQREQIIEMYVSHAERANNWDLVDLSAPKLLGEWVLTVDRERALALLDSLADSPNLWRQRMSIVCTWTTSRAGDPSWCLRMAERHLHHPHDLMHKAVGWMLREMGKRVSMDLLRDFLRQHVHAMPRTTLRYAIEKMDDAERRRWMTL